MVQAITSVAQFHEAIGQDKLTVVDFWATWCGPCKVISPVFESLEKEYPNATFLKCDVDDQSEVAAEVGIRAMPTFQFYQNGKKVHEVVGAAKEKLTQGFAQFAK